MIGWFNSRSIRTRVLISALVPLVVVTVTLGYYMTMSHLRDIDQQLVQRGTALVNSLAPLSEFGLFSENREMLYPLLQRALDEPDVQAVTIFDAEKHVILQGDRGRSEAETDAEQLKSQETLLVFTAPIQSSQVEVSDFPMRDPREAAKLGANTLGWVEVHISRASTEARQIEILRNSTLMVLAGILLSTLLALMIGRSVTRPVGKIIDTVSQLRKGRLEDRVPVEFGGELATLGEGINAMASTIGQAQDRLAAEVSQATSDLRSTVKSLENRNRELDEARKAAMQADEAKSEFLAKMSHEIRTPLNAVIGFSSLLNKTPQSEQQSEYTAIVSQAATSLLTVIDDILNISRLESGTLKLESADFNLVESLEAVVILLSGIAHEKGLELVFLVHSDVPERILADGDRIRQVLTNLLNNAVKFTESGHVVLEVSIDEAEDDGVTVRFEVTDTGIGMNAEQEKIVFEPFMQASPLTSRSYGGTGLGLSISKKLVDLLGGDIGVKSVPGQGSTFWFTVPARMRKGPERAKRTELRNIKALVYDLNDYARRSLRNRLISWGASVFVAGDRTRLRKLLGSARDAGEPYNLLLLGLPAEMHDEKAIIDMLDATADWPTIPVLLLVGDETHQLQIPAMVGRNFRVISKPARSRILLSNIRELLGTWKLAETAPVSGSEAGGSGKRRFEGLRILVAEDNHFNRELITRFLDDLGIAVQVAMDGREATQYAASESYDLIFMDIHMPVMGGVTAAQTIRKGQNRQTPIVALTADVFADRDQCLDATGIDDCVYKPVTDEKLIDVLDKWAGSCRSVTRLAGSVGRPSSGQEGVGPAGQDRGLPDEMLSLLHQELNEQIQALHAASRDGDPEGMRDHAHQLKGLAGYFGLAELHQLAGVLHQAVVAGRQAEIDTLLARLEAMARLVTGLPKSAEE